MTRKRRLLISVAAALLFLTALTIHSQTVTAAVSNARPAAAQGRATAAPASEGCAGTAEQSAPAYQHPDWWLGAIEYGFP